eukprot:486783-Pleurochrysis_carterae.AAC.1
MRSSISASVSAAVAAASPLAAFLLMNARTPHSPCRQPFDAAQLAVCVALPPSCMCADGRA